MGKADDSDAASKSGMVPIEVSAEGDGRLLVRLKHSWTARDFEQARRSIEEALASAGESPEVTFRQETGEALPATAVADILDLIRLAEQSGGNVDASALPDSLNKLLRLARSTPEKPQQPEPRFGRIERVGRQTVQVLHDCRKFIEFLGELIYSFGRLLTGRARYRRRDFWVTLQECGVEALPIVALLAVLTGTILGFVGAVQLRKFGATIYMTDLVGLAMAREMGCLMTGIIMSGRTGAAFAAQIGTMKVNQEIDALRTLGLSPVEFLVLPRTLALVLMMPLLTLFANALGWTGGFLVSIPMGINPAEYWKQLIDSLTLNHVVFGLSKSFFFGIVVAISGCYYGMLAKRTSAAVGEAATRAVVAGITWIVVLDAVFAFMDEVLAW